MQLVFSPIPATETFHKHGFLLAVSHFPYHSRIATQLLTSQEPVMWPFDREQHSPLGRGKRNILKRKKHNKKFFMAKIFFSVVFHKFRTIKKREKNFRFSGTYTIKIFQLKFLLSQWWWKSSFWLSPLQRLWQKELPVSIVPCAPFSLDPSVHSFLWLFSRFQSSYLLARSFSFLSPIPPLFSPPATAEEV